MKISIKDIRFPQECRTLVGKLHYLENPKIPKRIKRFGDVYVFGDSQIEEYQILLELQKDVILEYARPPKMNRVLLEDINKDKTIEDNLEDFNQVNTLRWKLLPRRKNKKWNEKLDELDELIGTDYCEHPKSYNGEESGNSLDRVFKRNYLPNTLGKKGIFHADNPVTLTGYIGLSNMAIVGVAYAVNPDVKMLPYIIGIGIVAAILFGVIAGYVLPENVLRKEPPFKEAKYLTDKIDELDLRN